MSEGRPKSAEAEHRRGGTAQFEEKPRRTTSATDPKRVEQIFAQLDELPMPWEPGLRGAGAGALAESIMGDACLQFEIRSVLALQAFDPRPARIWVDELITLHGMEGLRALVFALQALDSLDAVARESRGGLHRSEFRRHGLAVGCAAAQIAQVRDASFPAIEMLAAGLLHDLGKSALDAALPKSYARVLRRCESTGADIADVEQGILGVDHLAAGRHVALRWGLPQRFVECIWLHHHLPESLPTTVAAGGHVQIVQLADTLVRERRIGFSGTQTVSRASQLLAIQLGLAEEKRQAIADALPGELAARSAWLSPQTKANSLNVGAVEAARAEAARLSDENRRLADERRFFTAAGLFNQSVGVTASIREVCAAGAAALERAICSRVRSVIFTISEKGDWVDLGWAEGQTRSIAYERHGDHAGDGSAIRLAAQLAQSGAWLTPPPEALADIVDRARGALGTATTRFMPLTHENHMVGGALLSGDDSELALLATQSKGLSAFAQVIGLALARAREHSAVRRLTDELADAQRRAAAQEPDRIRDRTLDTVQTLAAGAAHELNNPLAVISGRAQLLHNRIANEPVRAVLKEIVNQAQAASDIVSALMDFARPPAPVPASIDLPDFFETLRAELAGTGLLDGRNLSVEVAPFTPSVWFDRTQLSQLLRELIANSVEATSPRDGRLTVKAAPDLAEEHVVVQVSDNGRGMTADVQARAMDPFFSHRPAGRGRGLGLARVHRWIAAGQATIRIDSQPDQGTTVTLRLPIPPVQTK